MPFKEKAIVRHKLRPDWGAGRVLARSEEYLQIDFTAGGLKKLKTSIADDHLEAASDEEARALKPAKAKAAAKRAIAKKTDEAPTAAAPVKIAVKNAAVKIAAVKSAAVKSAAVKIAAKGAKSKALK